MTLTRFALRSGLIGVAMGAIVAVSAGTASADPVTGALDDGLRGGGKLAGELGPLAGKIGGGGAGMIVDKGGKLVAGGGARGEVPGAKGGLGGKLGGALGYVDGGLLGKGKAGGGMGGTLGPASGKLGGKLGGKLRLDPEEGLKACGGAKGGGKGSLGGHETTGGKGMGGKLGGCVELGPDGLRLVGGAKGHLGPLDGDTGKRELVLPPR